jgi:hypothetical protein
LLAEQENLKLKHFLTKLKNVFFLIINLSEPDSLIFKLNFLNAWETNIETEEKIDGPGNP